MRWSTSVLLALGLGWCPALHAQVVPPTRHVAAGEFFWNTDPGVGNGLPLHAIDGTIDETVEALFRNGITPPAASGAHRFGIRVQDGDAGWSGVHWTIVHVKPDSPVLPPQRHLLMAEYFWDSDPGAGNGSPLLALDGSLDEVLESVLGSGIVMPSTPGTHTFHVRVKDSDGQWSSPFHTVVHGHQNGVVEPQSMKLVMAEYFWDNDPGPGNGQGLLALDGHLDETLEALLASGVATPVAAGPHRFSVRVKDFNHTWSSPFTTIVNVEAPAADQRLVTAEYFWDIDPGEGNGTSMSTVDGNMDEVLEAALATGVNTPAPVGPHLFGVRVQGIDGSWSAPFATVVNLSVHSATPPRAMHLVQSEYFWDIDPGQGSGNPLPAMDGTHDETLESLFESGVVMPTAPGPHLLHVRSRDVDGTWSTSFITVVSSADTSGNPAARHLVQSEYFWNADPGQGNGTPFPAMDGAHDETLESLFEPGVAMPTGAGPQLLHVRSRDVDGTWSTPFVMVVHPAVSVGGPPVSQLVEAEYFWDADPGVGNGVSFLAADGACDETVETAFRNALPTPGNFGPHSFNVRAKDITGTWSPVFTTIVRLTIGKGGVGYVYGDDNDGDTLDNLFELFLGTNPDQHTEVSKHLKWVFKPLAGGVPGQEQFYVRVERNHVAPDTSLIVEVSPNLVDWYRESDGWVVQTLDSPGALEFQSTAASLGAPRLFFRFVLAVVGD